MIAWERVTGFQWNAGNARKSVDNHGVSQTEAEQVFFNEPLLTVPDAGDIEQRFHARGRADDGRRLHITFTLRDEETRIRVISARDMSRKERGYHEQDT